MEASDYSTPDSAASNGSSSQSPWAAHEAATPASARPEIPVIGAFIGGFVFARVLKMLGGDDD